MNKPILHRSLKSPYSEKVMLLMGYLNQPYFSFIAPKGIPRPIEEKLVGAYSRRIPILQIGADLYCDSELITSVLAKRSSVSSLIAYPCAEEASYWIEKIEMQGSPILSGAFSALELIYAYFLNMPANHAWHFMTDRMKLAKTFNLNEHKTSQAEKHLQARSYFEKLNHQLANQSFMLTPDNPTTIDFAAYTMVYFHDVVNHLKLAENLPNLQRWFERMKSFGTGEKTEITGDDALQVAKSSEPTQISDKLLASSNIGKKITFCNKGFLAEINTGVEGVIVGEDSKTIILRRENPDVGTVHVHFPKLSY